MTPVLSNDTSSDAAPRGVAAGRFVKKKDAAGHVLSMPDGSTVKIRPIRPDDRDALITFHRKLSDKTVYMRYFSPVSLERRTAAACLAQELCNDPDHHLTLVAERTIPDSDTRLIVGVGRLVLQSDDPAIAEFALTIRDDFHGMGLGATLLDALINHGRAEHLKRITAVVLSDNVRMLQLCREHGFKIVSHDPGGPIQCALDVSPLLNNPG